jgi:hypothetical protein
MIKDELYFDNLNTKLDVLYLTDYEKYKEVIKNISCDDLVVIQDSLRHERANDPNFSYMKEKVTCVLAGFSHHKLSQKHGLDSPGGGESKPESIIDGGSKRQLTGKVAFADMEINKINYLYDNDITILSSGFVGAICLYVIGIKMKNDVIKQRLIDENVRLTKKGKRRVLSFSRTHYDNDERNVLYYINPDFDSYKKYLGKPHFNFIKGLPKAK